MKKLFLLTKTLLVAVCLLVGASNAWAETIFSWEGNAGSATVSGGTVTANNAGTDITTTRVNVEQASFYVIQLAGYADFTTEVAVIELDDYLIEGDQIKVTAFRNHATADKQSGFKAIFNIGSSTVASSTGLEFVNINAAGDSNYGTTPNTCTFNVPADALGSNVITMTRSHTQTSLWITKIEIVRKANTVVASLNHTAGGGWTSAASHVSTVDAEGEYYNNDSSNGWAGCAYAKFSFSIPEGQALSSASLVYSINQGGNSADGYAEHIYYMKNGFDIDWATFGGQSNTDLRNTGNRQAKVVDGTKSGGKGVVKNITRSVTTAVRYACEGGQNYVLLQWTGNSGSANLYGKGSTLELQPKLLITTVEETVTTPTIGVTYDGDNRKVVITSGTSNVGSTVKTYYTIDGTTPTSSSTLYDGEIDIAANCTIKAITISVYGNKSSVAEQAITVGKLAVAAPTITITSMVDNSSCYSPLFTIANGDNSGILGIPTPTLSATFNGSAIDISGGTFTPSIAGTLVVTAAAEGYTSASTEKDVYGVYACQSTPNYDEIPLADLETTIGGTWVDDGTSRWAYWSTTGGKNADLTTNGGGSYAQYKLTSSGSVTHDTWFTFTRNRGSSNLSILAGYGLGQKSYVPTLKINSPVADAIVEYSFGSTTPAVSFVMMTSSDETAKLWSRSLELAKVLRYCKYYTPVTSVSATITPAGWASFSSSYPLDLSTISGGEAYYASAANGETVTLTPTGDVTVPAGEGLMIKGTPNATFTIDVAASGTAISGNLLKGQTTTGNVAASPSSGAGTYHYVFGYKKPVEEVTEYGFYNLASNTEVAAGKAYLEITSNGARALRISLGGITEVENIEAVPEAKAQEGKFIENGKLVIIKNGVKYNAAGAKLY